MSAPKSTNEAEIRQFPAPAPASKVEAPAKSEAPQHEVAATTPAPPKRSVKRFILPVIIVAAVGAGAWYGHEWWTTGRFMVSTDDAYIQGDITAIAPKITGYIDTINVVANQRVKAGDPLITLDNGDYTIAEEQAEAQIATQRLTLLRIQAQTEAAKASVKQVEAGKVAAQAVLTNAEAAATRAGQLHATRFASQSQLDDATAALDQAKANLVSADAQIAAAVANVGVLEAQYKEAEGSIASLQLSKDKAARDLSFTVIRAPLDGVVGNLSAKKGDLVTPGQRLAALVPVNALYIDANYKETQLRDIVPGEKVRVRVDALSGDTFEGTVASIAPASGAVFSLLPAENATGNFTKVVQRVPVRIALPADILASGRLQAGLSVIVDVDTRTAPAK
ncbi:HlyD family secretion protein [Phyllobacterium myrsinacearum]|uniref:HlyD family secretion protein n=2 Tax=Pseudomonadota TaxID=1224 RepID=A0A2S9JWD5_9HYPH|nr:HlyD family secretion protein [Phyllobacterium myrsinacearum]PRD57667.1 HlyD family secretion protein [Phyllobacterium myrsinacearum]PWV87272.1 membrane fusion protein (multidrug efflux system) [Phyllobacterium myrsinacearum]RZS83095.1 membrane fusion protein (multidrug efflux system) [Phyllobacterium myrsinacearum]RZV10193.1 membrane fusion protein (multidrug efflux system) [Phyllobacterium myrsinacearum]